MPPKDCSSCSNSAYGSCSLKRGLRGVIEPLEPRRLMASNVITVENALAGTPQGTWDVPTQDTSIMGFATDISVDQGQTVNFKIDDKAKAAYHIDIYRMGYYQGNGARKITTIASSSTLKTAQPAALTNAQTGLVDAGNWSVTASWAVPGTAVSGLYFGKVVREDTGGASLIYFVVRDDDGNSDVIFKTSDTTWQAYNDWGGNSLYVGSSALNPVGSTYPRAVKVSYNRPLSLRDTYGGLGSFNDPMHAEYPMIRFMEQNGYSISYTTDVDLDRRGSELLEHKAFLSVGHDEYWSLNERNAMEAARNAGVNMAFFSGNEGYWKVRWENSTDSSATPYRTLVCYKETHAQAKTDPLAGVWTGQWRDPRFGPQDGGRPENALTGQLFAVNRDTVELGVAMQVPASYGNLRLWRNTTIATATTTTTLSNYTLGYEWDEDVDNGQRPLGLFNLSSTTRTVPQKLVDTYSGFGAPCPSCGGIANAGCGCVVGTDTATHTLTEYRAPSGALVFGAGTVQWSWGLDGTHIDGASTVDKRMQQATINLLADMKAQPASLMSGLVAAAASTDASPPVALITTSLTGVTLALGKAVTIAGTATDTGGGVVAGVEVSTDGGATWHPASGRGSWSYSWIPTQGGVANIRARAVDDSGNIQSSPASITSPSVPGPFGQTILGDVTPVDGNDLDTDASTGIELGVKFKTDSAGYITGIRFYKGTTFNSGTHIGNLWSATGTKLGSLTFTNEGTSGWQSAAFATPIFVQANTTYVASYFAPVGHYASDEGYFLSRTAGNQQVHSLAETSTVGNGLYKYGSTSSFPNSSYQATNFYVDVFFQPGVDSTPPTVTNRSPASGAGNVATASKITATFNEAINVASLVFTLKDASNNVVATATPTYDAATQTATLAPSAVLAGGKTYTVSVKASDTSGNAMAAADVWTFTTAAADITPPSIIARTPAAGATGIATSTPISVTFNEDVLSGPGSILFTVTNTSTSAAVTGTISYNSSTRTATFAPTSPLSYSTGYTVSVKATDLSNNAMAAASTSTFTTAALPTGQLTVWPASSVPGVTADVDGGAVELGMQFKVDVAGTVSGVRFYKGTTNTGTHVGNLWTSAGVKLATVTFANETASGWQQMLFATPVAIAANTVYVVSYFAPKGHYAADESYFASAGVDNGPLHALSNANGVGNGLYRYGAASAFPNASYNATNYWVDVVYTASPQTLVASAMPPNPPTTATVSLTATSSTKTRSSMIDLLGLV